MNEINFLHHLTQEVTWQVNELITSTTNEDNKLNITLLPMINTIVKPYDERLCYSTLSEEISCSESPVKIAQFASDVAKKLFKDLVYAQYTNQTAHIMMHDLQLPPCDNLVGIKSINVRTDFISIRFLATGYPSDDLYRIYFYIAYEIIKPVIKSSIEVIS